MKYLFLLFLSCLSFSTFAQEKETPKIGLFSNLQGFAEFSPFLAAFQLVSIQGGVEFSHYLR
jgi:hypothetical protein